MKKPDLKEFFSDKPAVKYACAKQCVALAKDNPEILYPDLDFFANFLESTNQVLKWNALQTIGYLSKIDDKKEIDAILPKIISMLNSGSLITASNAAMCLTEIAKNKPYLRSKIFGELIKVEDYKYKTPECTNVVIGNVIKALVPFAKELSKYRNVMNFINRQTKISRASVAIRASKLLSKTSVS
jgi:hypothetical protein